MHIHAGSLPRVSGLLSPFGNPPNFVLSAPLASRSHDGMTDLTSLHRPQPMVDSARLAHILGVPAPYETLSALHTLLFLVPRPFRQHQ